MEELLMLKLVIETEGRENQSMRRIWGAVAGFWIVRATWQLLEVQGGPLLTTSKEMMTCVAYKYKELNYDNELQQQCELAWKQIHPQTPELSLADTLLLACDTISREPSQMHLDFWPTESVW